MITRHVLFLKVVRWTGWFLLPLVLGFLVTGYGLKGRYGAGALFAAPEQASALHNLLHVPLLILVAGHVLPALYLAMQRWGWIKQG